MQPLNAPSPQPQGGRVSLRTIVLFSVIFWLVPFVGNLVNFFIDELIVVYIAALLTSSMHPLVTWLHRRGIPRSLSILMIYLLVAGLLGLAVLLAVPLFTEETAALIKHWPQYEAQLNKPLSHLGIHLGRGTSGLANQLGGMAGALPALVSNISAVLVDVVVIFVLSFFFTVDEHFAVRLVSFVAPPRYRARTNEIVADIGNRMGRWVLGQMVIVLYYGVTFSLGLGLLGVPYALSVGVVTAILEMIPFVGGFVGLILGLLVAVSHSFGLLIPVIALYLVITNVEAHLIVPNLYGKAIQLHPATVIIALLIGARAFGIVGALIAMPLAAAAQVLFEELYVHDVIRPAEEQEARIPSLRLQAPLVVRWPRRRVEPGQASQRPGHGPTIG